MLPEGPVVAGQAAFRYSWMRLSHRLVRTTVKVASQADRGLMSVVSGRGIAHRGRTPAGSRLTARRGAWGGGRLQLSPERGLDVALEVRDVRCRYDDAFVGRRGVQIAGLGRKKDVAVEGGVVGGGVAVVSGLGPEVCGVAHDGRGHRVVAECCAELVEAGDAFGLVRAYEFASYLVVGDFGNDDLVAAGDSITCPVLRLLARSGCRWVAEQSEWSAVEEDQHLRRGVPRPGGSRQARP